MFWDDFNDAIEMREFADAQSGGSSQGIPSSEWVEQLMDIRRAAEIRGTLSQPLV